MSSNDKRSSYHKVSTQNPASKQAQQVRRFAPSHLLRIWNKYWYVWIPAILLNLVISIDHVAANHRERAIKVSLSAAVTKTSQPQDEQALNQTLRAHWIQANKDGAIEGRISALDSVQASAIPLENLDVTLLKSGLKVGTAVTDEEGRFVLTDVQPGVYTLVAAGQNGFLAYGVNVLPQLEEFEGLDQNAKFDSPETKQAFLVSHFDLPPETIIQDELQIDAAAVPPEFTTLHRISQNYMPASGPTPAVKQDQDDTKAIDKATEIRGGFQFPLTADGTFKGRIQPIATEDGKSSGISDMNAFLIQDDLEVARVPIDEEGNFEIEQVDPGVYSLIAAGKDGFAALSLELHQPFGEAEESAGVGHVDSAYQLVTVPAIERPADQPLGIAFINDQGDLNFIRSEIERVAKPPLPGGAPAPPFAGVGPGGFPAGPNGFVPNTGFVGGELPVGVPGDSGFVPGNNFGPRRGGRGGRLALIGAIIAVAATNNDTPVQNPPLASPATQ